MTENSRPAADPELPVLLVRTLRHEIGDFLQTVYSAAALLQVRLPSNWSTERTIVGNLRGRAGACKDMLDTLLDFVSPGTLNLAEVRLGELAQSLLAVAELRYGHLRIDSQVEGKDTIEGDATRLGHVGQLMLQHACDSARSRVTFRTAGLGPDEVEWHVSDDGVGLSPEALERVFEPFPVSRRGTLEIGLAPARQLVLQHGGRMSAATLPEGGLRVSATLPRRHEKKS